MHTTGEGPAASVINRQQMTLSQARKQNIEEEGVNDFWGLANTDIFYDSFSLGSLLTL